MWQPCILSILKHLKEQKHFFKVDLKTRLMKWRLTLKKKLFYWPDTVCYASNTVPLGVSVAAGISLKGWLDGKCKKVVLFLLVAFPLKQYNQIKYEELFWIREMQEFIKQAKETPPSSALAVHPLGELISNNNPVLRHILGTFFTLCQSVFSYCRFLNFLNVNSDEHTLCFTEFKKSHALGSFFYLYDHPGY